MTAPITPNPIAAAPSTQRPWVRETGFGRWFLSTQTWYKYVLSTAIADFAAILGARLPQAPRVLDAGCGEGLAFGLLASHFAPRQIVGVDIDAVQLEKARARAQTVNEHWQCIAGDISTSSLASGSFDMIFCHQLLHHTQQQQAVLVEFLRLLTPGGVLFVGESCKSFIESLPVKFLFRHPPLAQKTAQGYIDLVRGAGFSLRDVDTYSSRPWWSRRTLGLSQKLGLAKRQQEPTEILMVAFKPQNLS